MAKYNAVPSLYKLALQVAVEKISLFIKIHLQQCHSEDRGTDVLKHSSVNEAQLCVPFMKAREQLINAISCSVAEDLLEEFSKQKKRKARNQLSHIVLPLLFRVGFKSFSIHHFGSRIDMWLNTKWHKLRSPKILELMYHYGASIVELDINDSLCRDLDLFTNAVSHMSKLRKLSFSAADNIDSYLAVVGKKCASLHSLRISGPITRVGLECFCFQDFPVNLILNTCCTNMEVFTVSAVYRYPFPGKLKLDIWSLVILLQNLPNLLSIGECWNTSEAIAFMVKDNQAFSNNLNCITDNLTVGENLVTLSQSCPKINKIDLYSPHPCSILKLHCLETVSSLSLDNFDYNSHTETYFKTHGNMIKELKLHGTNSTILDLSILAKYCPKLEKLILCKMNYTYVDRIPFLHLKIAYFIYVDIAPILNSIPFVEELYIRCSKGNMRNNPMNPAEVLLPHLKHFCVLNILEFFSLEFVQQMIYFCDNLESVGSFGFTNNAETRASLMSLKEKLKRENRNVTLNNKVCYFVLKDYFSLNY